MENIEKQIKRLSNVLAKRKIDKKPSTGEQNDKDIEVDDKVQSIPKEMVDGKSIDQGDNISYKDLVNSSEISEEMKRKIKERISKKK